jgi:AraC family cel operon transcriptional repressor
VVAVTPAVVERLQEWAIAVADQPDHLMAEAALLDVARLAGSAQRSLAQGGPSWLVDAVREFQEPRHLIQGPAAFRRLAGRHADHLNRVVRRWHGCTATVLANAIRLDVAARLLRLDGGDVDAVAVAVGFASRPHFHRAFLARHGCTPGWFRRSHRAAAAPPLGGAVRVDRPRWRGGAAP